MNGTFEGDLGRSSPQTGWRRLARDPPRYIPIHARQQPSHPIAHILHSLLLASAATTVSYDITYSLTVVTTSVMGFFDSIQKPGFKAAKGKNPHIHQEVTRAPTPPRTPIPLSQRLNNRTLLSKRVPKQNGAARKASPKPRDQNSRKRAVATPQRLESDSDDDGADQDLEDSRKRVRRNSKLEPDLNRQIRSRKAFAEEDDGKFPIVHAADIASLSRPAQYILAFPNDPQATEINLQYPSASQREKYGFVHGLQIING